MPFALCWVRAAWSKLWQGQSNDTRYKTNQLLIDVACPAVSHPYVQEHYNFLKRFFFHPNYIRVNNVPVFVLLDWIVKLECDEIVNHFRQLAMQDGAPAPGLHVVRIHTLKQSEFYAHGKKVAQFDTDPLSDAVLFYPYSDLNPKIPAKIPEYCFRGIKTPFKKTLYAAVMASFDNTPRRHFNNSAIYKRSFSSHGHISDFGFDLVQTMIYERCCQNDEARSKGANFVAINAFNEWGEGNVLEPSESYGYKYLETLKAAKKTAEELGCNWAWIKEYNDKYLSNKKM